MTADNVKQHIERIIEKASRLLVAAYNNNDGAKTRLCFPKYPATCEDRVSEQEFRFAFVEAFNDYVIDERLDWYYAVEVPTTGRYHFISITEPEMQVAEGRSAMFDLVIYDRDKRRICIIEFKAGNPKQFCYDKDYRKLMNPCEGGHDVLRYFLQLLRNHNSATVESIKKKTIKAIEGNQGSDICVISKAFSLKGRKITELPLK